MNPVHANVDTEISTSKIVTRVFDQILESIHEGLLQPGEHISDTKLAETYGVSRTPVREALQRLREIGVVEASPNRFTRVSVVGPSETAEAMVVWLALFDVLLDEVILRADDTVLALMIKDHAEFVKAIARMDMQSAATANFDFFTRLTVLSKNAALRRAITSVVHIIRLGSLNLPEYLDTSTLATAQKMFVDALRARNRGIGHDAMVLVRGIVIPQ
ncbi:MAG: GntR family transcriptional regulator [Microbacteriaceae bacterium]|nr:GntR family transcriptional regulator [Microbacteriaceae bacterium]